MLVVCTNCRRHVRDDEPACPFCREKRTWRLAVAASAIAMAAVGCGNNTEVKQPTSAQDAGAPDAAELLERVQRPQPEYGCPGC
jgi:hypothetical protein